jgi:N-formylglutamate amidohydrolase
VERRLDAVYRPYHRALQALLQRKLARFGHVVLLCAHSMPSQPRPAPHGTRQPAPPPRADIVPGTRGRTSALAPVIDRVDAHARAHGFSVRHDDPYRGGYSTATYGRPAQGVHAVQIEIARRLYMDETSLRIDVQGFRIVREFARTLAARLAEPPDDRPILDGAPRNGSPTRSPAEPFHARAAEPRRSR